MAIPYGTFHTHSYRKCFCPSLHYTQYALASYMICSSRPVLWMKHRSTTRHISCTTMTVALGNACAPICFSYIRKLHNRIDSTLDTHSREASRRRSRKIHTPRKPYGMHAVVGMKLFGSLAVKNMQYICTLLLVWWNDDVDGSVSMERSSEIETIDHSILKCLLNQL